MHIDSSDTHIRHECRHWLVLMSSGDASDRDRARFQEWLARDPRHRIAFDKLHALWNQIGSLQELAKLERVPPLPAAADRVRRGRDLQRWSLAAAAIAAVALLAWTGLHRRANETLASFGAGIAQEYSTDVAQVRDIDLADGSILTLGAQSRAVVEISPGERRVRLIKGQAFFAVARDTTRPFEVTAQNAVVRVVGTRFDVHRGPDGVRIAVSQGVVNVHAADAGQGSAARRLTAGQRIDVAQDGTLRALSAVGETEIGAWRAGRLAYDDASLREIVADLNRYGTGVEIDSAETGALRITAAFRVDQIESFVAGLPSILPVALERNGTGRFVLSRRDVASTGRAGVQ